jgi:methyl-accepting chemotaxis protein
MSHSKFGIKGKLLLLIGCAVGAFAVLAAYSTKSVLGLKSQVELLGLYRIPISQEIGNIRASSNAVPRFMWLSLAYGPGTVERNKSIEKVEVFLDLWKKALTNISRYEMTDAAKVKLTEIQDLVTKLIPVIDAGTSAVKKHSKEGDLIARDLLMTRMPPLAVRLTQLILELSSVVESRNHAIVAEAQSKVTQVITILTILAVTMGFTLCLFGVIFSTRLAKQLIGITNSVADASHQVSAASGQLSNAAEQLSSASQEQAAATEETSAALTEISGMVESNVQGAEKTNEYAREVHAVSEVTKKSMQDLKAAMGEIYNSNSRIEQLVKVIEEIGEKTEVIDDIVFKTQLLSFNASVEAERAGEQGRGFAVVAQEVGNLAQMSGKAATEIAGIVKRSIKEATEVARENKGRVERGETLATETGEKMTGVLESLANILDATNKIVAASKEQSQGISQISTSVDGLNQSTQEIASTSEESASASEQLSAQAQSLLSLVENLRIVVTGSSTASQTPGESVVFQKAPPASSRAAKVVSIKDHSMSRKAAEGSLARTENVPLKKASGSHLESDGEWEKL